MADVNGDGKLDIYICRSADANAERRKNLLYINNGDLNFSEQAAQYGLADNGYSTQAAFFDYDKDGDLDIFLINHSLKEYAGDVFTNPTLRKERQPAYASKLYRNDEGHFINVSDEAGITNNVLSFGLGLAISDINLDGWPDVYVSNDFNEPDYRFGILRTDPTSNRVNMLLNKLLLIICILSGLGYLLTRFMVFPLWKGDAF